MWMASLKFYNSPRIAPFHRVSILYISCLVFVRYVLLSWSFSCSFSCSWSIVRSINCVRYFKDVTYPVYIYIYLFFQLLNKRFDFDENTEWLEKVSTMILVMRTVVKQFQLINQQQFQWSKKLWNFIHTQ